MRKYDRDELVALLQSRDEWYVWILEFGLTHSVMQLALHPGTYPSDVTFVDCGDCYRIEAVMQGGPYVLEIEDVIIDGRRLLRFQSRDGAFALVCGRMKIGRRRTATLDLE